MFAAPDHYVYEQVRGGRQFLISLLHHNLDASREAREGRNHRNRRAGRSRSRSRSRSGRADARGATAEQTANGSVNTDSPLRVRAAAWSKWPSWRGHSWPPRALQAASEGLGLASALVRSDPAPRIPPRGRDPWTHAVTNSPSSLRLTMRRRGAHAALRPAPAGRRGEGREVRRR